MEIFLVSKQKETKKPRTTFFTIKEKALSLHKDLKWKSLDAAEVASFINIATNY